ncbi:MAG TPA: hypothetical protein VE861_03145 [Gemmatimonadaceae bacterium]|nr:hypothetical protein [Gemmatimonadaceae bacterium]
MSRLGDHDGNDNGNDNGNSNCNCIIAEQHSRGTADSGTADGETIGGETTDGETTDSCNAKLRTAAKQQSCV